MNERGYAILDRIAEPATMDQLLAEVQPWAERAERLQLKFFGGGLSKVESVITKSRARNSPESNDNAIHHSVHARSAFARPQVLHWNGW